MASRPLALTSRAPHSSNVRPWDGTIHPLSIAYAPRERLGLGPPNPERMDLAPEPLGLRWVWFAQTMRYSCRHSHSSPLQPAFQLTFAGDGDAPLPRTRSAETGASSASVPVLAPLHCRRHTTRPVSCYALFQGWLLLSQPPGCLGNATALTTIDRTRGP